MRKRWWLAVILAVIVIAGVVLVRSNSNMMLNPMGQEVVVELPYEQYEFERLVTRADEVSQIEVGPSASSGQATFSYLSEGKKITGAITIPEGKSPFPVVVMLRGYVDKEIYTTGMGTQNGAKYYSEHGYVTVAPDFLGYGGSDPEDENSLGARVRRPVAVLDLIASLESLEIVDTSRVYLWGHSNGGQIALSILEILGRREELGLYDQSLKAATLWAPVSRPFPYSILYYTYDWADRGKALRRVIAEWEKDYEADKYSVERYWDWIRTPIQIHQGMADEAVPVNWSDELVMALEEREKEVQYYRYPGTDHNMRPSWSTVVVRDVSWFEQK